MPDRNPLLAERVMTSLATPLPATAPTPSPTESTSRSPSAHLRETRQRTAWSRKIAGWMLLSTLLIWGGAALAWATLWLTPKSNAVGFDGQPTLHEATRVWARSGETPNFDQLCLCLNATLPALYGFDPDGPQMRPFIKGIVVPRLISDADAAFRRDRTVITQRGIRQIFSMKMPATTDIKFDEESRRVSVIVRGQFELTFQKEPKTRSVTLPFTGRVILSRNIPSALNPFNFYIEDVIRTEQ